MRTTLRCPKCDCREILHIKEIQDKDQIKRGAVLSIQGRRPSWVFGSFENVGVIEAYVCSACGFTELYTKKPEELEVDGDIIERLTAPPTPPFR